MSDRLPPLTALRAFEAAARHMSFAKAAEELSVTPAALSFQIKSLEDHLGLPVFHRLNRAVELTEAGRLLRPGVAEGFEALGAAWRSTRRLADTQTLTVTAGPAFTAKWLAPRLFGFARAHPEIELRFSASLRIVDIERDDIDVAVRYGYGPDTGLYSRPLLRDWLGPMMTPELAKEYTTPETLQNAPLLYQDDLAFQDPPCDWAAWFRAAGVAGTPPSGAHFSQSDHAIDAALEGVGVVLGRSVMAQKAMREGRLVAPFETALTTEAHFRVICAMGAETRPQIAAFVAWILAEAGEASTDEKGRRYVPAADVAPS